MKISEIITDKYKLRMPPTVYYDLLADVVETEEKQEPMNRDCVSRDYLLSLANKDGAYGYVSAHEIINAPPVNPQEKTGHWIQTNEFFINQDGQFIYKFICSECKSLSYFRKSNKKAIGANVCSNCGCRMVEPQERSE